MPLEGRANGCAASLSSIPSASTSDHDTRRGPLPQRIRPTSETRVNPGWDYALFLPFRAREHDLVRAGKVGQDGGAPLDRLESSWLGLSSRLLRWSWSTDAERAPQPCCRQGLLSIGKGR